MTSESDLAIRLCESLKRYKKSLLWLHVQETRSAMEDKTKVLHPLEKRTMCRALGSTGKFEALPTQFHSSKSVLTELDRL